jgi:hypothetical protein
VRAPSATRSPPSPEEASLLTPLDDTPWHQLPTTFDHVGTSDVRFFDRLWFAASDRRGGGALQFTMGVYQNMNVVDGGFVAIHEGRQHNVRVSRQLRPTYDTACGPLRIEVLEPLQRLRLTVAPNAGTVHGELEWVASFAAQEERRHFNRQWGRILEDYSRYDQIGELSGWLDVEGTRVELDSWWACRDHSWGVRERVGVPEPYTGEVPPPSASMFAFLFWSTDTHGGHVQVTRRDGANHLTAEILDRTTGRSVVGERVAVDATFVDDRRPRRFDRATFEVTDEAGGVTTFEVEAQGPAVAMPGLGYGGYDDGLGLGVHRGVEHLEAEVWDVSHPAEVGHPAGTVGRPVHRIQPVRLTVHGPAGTSHGTGSFTFIAEVELDADGHLRAGQAH